ncbi:MAG: methanethiol S-methyltransferase [Gemmatimonadaceae bacterium]
MSKTLAFIYGIIAYALFLVSFVYAIGFVGNFVVPKSVDSGRVVGTWTALIIDAVLLTLFAVQHSGMARRGFKRWLTRFIPEPIERSTYVLCASVILLLLYALWRPVPSAIWNVSAATGVAVLWALFALGWAIVLLSTFMIGHFDLFGLKQVWLNATGRASSADEFRMPAFYRIVRHPLMVGFLIAFWATPFMSAGHLLFSIATTGYILIAVQLEERDLVAVHGEEYLRYRREVPAFVPLSKRAASARAEASTRGA